MMWWRLKDKIAIAQYFIIALVLLHGHTTYAQSYQELRDRYPGSIKVKTRSEMEYRIKHNKSGINITSQEIEEYTIIDEKGIMDNKLSAYHSELVPIISQEAYTILPTNKKITMRDIKEKDYESGSIFHNGVKEKVIQYGYLELGSKKYHQVEKQYKDPYLLHKHIFAEGVPQLHNRFRIVVDKGVHIGYRIFNDEKHHISFTKKENRNNTVYEWELQESKPFRSESNNLGILYTAPHLVFYIEAYTDAKGEQIPMMGSVQLLSDYYAGFVKDLNKKEYPQLKQLAQTITQGLHTPEAKIKAIYYWVKDNIRYVAFESGYEGFIPREAGLIYDRKFGDCKDMASIITAMASYADVPNVYLTWIGTTELPYTYEQVPTPAVDNHMIASYYDGKDYIFLDATNKETPYGLPSSFIQGKEALIKTEQGFKIVKVPPVPASMNQYRLITDMKISTDNTISGSAQVSMSGLLRDQINNTISGAKSERRQDYFNSLLKLGNNKFAMSDLAEHNLRDRDTSYILDYRYQFQDYIVTHGDEAYMSMFIDQPWQSLLMEDNRKSPFDFKFLQQYRYTISLAIPDGYELTFIPKDAIIDNNVIKYLVKYEHQGNQLTLDFTLENKQLALHNPEEFTLWNESIKLLTKEYKETIIMKKRQ